MSETKRRDGTSLDGWERARMNMGAQGVYKALMAWKVEFDLANGTEPKTPWSSGRGVGHADLLLQAAMIAFGEDQHAAELRVSEDWQEILASRG